MSQGKPCDTVETQQNMCLMQQICCICVERFSNIGGARLRLLGWGQTAVAGTFQITVGGTFPPLISLRDYDVDTDNMIIPAAYNTAGTDTGIEILGKNVAGKAMWHRGNTKKHVLNATDLLHMRRKVFEYWGRKAQTIGVGANFRWL